MTGVICKVVSCPYYCQGFCGNRMITVNAQGLCNEVARAQRVGWEPHSLIDEYGDRPIITIVENQECEIDDTNGENSIEESNSGQDCGNDAGDVN